MRRLSIGEVESGRIVVDAFVGVGVKGRAGNEGNFVLHGRLSNSTGAWADGSAYDAKLHTGCFFILPQEGIFQKSLSSIADDRGEDLARSTAVSH